MLGAPFVFWLRSRLASSVLSWFCSSAKYRAAAGLALAISLAAVASSAASANSLVGDWSFDEEAGTVAADLSGHENTGEVLNGAERVAGKFSYALFFDGLDDYVVVPHSESLDIENELTVSAWVHNRTPQNGLLTDAEYRIIAAKGWAGAADGSWTLAFDKKKNEFSFFARKSSNDGFGRVSLSAANLSDDWHLITAVLNNGELSLYVDGTLAAGPVALGTDGINRNAAAVWIGAVDPASASAVFPWFGEIDEFQIYNRALSDAEISALYEGMAAQETFDFVLSSAGDVAVYRGTVAITSVHAARLYGEPGNIAFEVTGLPEGAKARLSSKKCKPDCTAIVKIKTRRSTPVGNYPIVITAKNADKEAGGAMAASASRSTAFNLAVTAPTVETPLITPNGGVYAGPVSVRLQTGTSGAAIHYTTDGTTPTQSSPRYKKPFTISGPGVVKAKAFKKDYNPSAEATAVFTAAEAFDFSFSNSGDRSVSAGGSVENVVTAALVSGAAQIVGFSVSGLPAEASASFSSSGCSPTCSSTLTIGTSSSTPAGSYTITVAATGGGVTRTTSFGLTVSLPTVATPTISPNGGSYTGSVSVTLQSATAGASIYYTTDGSTPTQSSALYTGAIALTGSALVKAKAFKSGYNPSGEASATFTITPSKLTLSWQDNSSNEDNFRIERKAGSAGTYVSVATVAANVKTYVDGDVVSGNTYCYRVQAVNAAGASGYSNEGCAVAP
ncbi:MAG TPA: chitobiase/beta-hexosaminidase C-terminal domain-containing protein [Candidatus Acidoferrales bacterium]|nr:chitobiase/beta-hexosaminidase C-terminal domain-containing protein [Candidatus Acidoferrales bacterium]